MESSGKNVVVYHATPLCRKCDNELSKVRRASERAGADMQVTFSLWKRIKYGLRFFGMPVVVVNNRAFSVLGSFGEETLASELKKEKGL